MYASHQNICISNFRLALYYTEIKRDLDVNICFCLDLFSYLQFKYRWFDIFGINQLHINVSLIPLQNVGVPWNRIIQFHPKTLHHMDFFIILLKIVACPKSTKALFRRFRICQIWNKKKNRKITPYLFKTLEIVFRKSFVDWLV